MSVSGVTSGSNAVAVYTPPVQHQAAKAPPQTPKTDTVTISKQAQQLATDGDPSALEAQESSSEKTGETYRGKA